MEVIAENKLTKDLLETNNDVDIFEDPVTQNRRVSVFDASSRTTSSQIPSLPLSGSPTDNDTSAAAKATKLSRKAIVEVPIAVSEENGVKIAPNARMSMNSSFPLQHKAWSGRLEATAVVRGYTGYTTQDASVKCDVNKTTSLQAGLSAVRNRRKIYVDAKTTSLGNQRSLSARYSQIATSRPLRGAEVSLAATQGYSFGMLSSRCMLPVSSPSPMAFSLSMVSKTVHKWQINIGWNQLHNFSWKVGTNLLLREYQTLRLSVGQIRQGILALSGTFAQKIRDKMSFSVALSHNASQGTLWIFSWSNGDLSINIPISLLDYHDAWASVALTALSKVIQDAVTLTLRLDKLAAESTELELKALHDKQQAARAEALNQQDLMKRQAQSRMNAEKEKNGLIILNAAYYATSDKRNSLNVTVPLQFWVSDGSLELPAGSKKNLLGFFDVAAAANQTKAKKEARVEVDSSVWSRKFWTGFFRLPKVASKSQAAKPLLMITYEFKGRRDQVEIRDEEKLILPRF